MIKTGNNASSLLQAESKTVSSFKVFYFKFRWNSWIERCSFWSETN